MYIKLKFKFWSLQPVFHIYDINHWINPNKIINKNLPTINKYINFVDIETFDIKNCPPETLENACLFIKNNYLRSSNAEYLPKSSDILSYLETTNNKSFISIYWNNSNLGKEIVATITARPMYVTYQFPNKKPISFSVNYIDNLTVHKLKRKSGYAPRMIQTHHYHIRHLNLNNQICLFKREGELTAIIPITTYNTIGYKVNEIIELQNMIKINKITSLVKINKTNFAFFKDEIKSISSQFTLQVNIELTTLFNLILNNKIIIYCTILDNKIYSYYIYRNTPSIINKNLKCVELICSINNSPYVDDYFHHFISSLRRLKRKYKIDLVYIEEIAHSITLTKLINSYKIPIFSSSPTAFFLYNYAAYSLPSKDCLILY